ncbi:tetratricopeptide repeat protein [Desulfovibrio aminophilus]|uniref:tetratricopeptide repeat protein n=1 Tax=Desulfovibrio aminophilus TaxID=81425 RepID=UPI000421A7BC|nr:tetratricopeptide repeat protein [Desulfovibrio aminophilus]
MKQPTQTKQAKRFGWPELLLTALAALLVGFYAGTVFVDAYRADKAGSAPTAQTQTPAARAEDESHEAERARITILERQVAAKPDDLAAWIELGNLAFDTHQPNKAAPAYEAALKLDPRNPDVWTDLGIMYRDLGRFRDAVTAFDKAVALDPGHDNARFNKGVVLLHDLKDRDGALEAWEGLVRVNPLAQTPDGRPLVDVIAETRKAR